MSTPQANFGQMIATVAGQAFAAAGYQLQVTPLHNMRGLFRYEKSLADGVSAYVEFQLLFYQGGGPSRFRVNLLRNQGDDARSTSTYANRVDITLSRLLWDIFDVQVLGSADFWWLFNDPNQLAHAIADAGRLVFGFAIPWLEGTLTPDNLDAERD